MRKLNILKTIVDIMWILAMLSVPLILFLFGFIFISDDISDFNIAIYGIRFENTGFGAKLILAVMLSSYFLLIYCLYLFKKSLSSFQKLNIFDETVIVNFNKIGYLLIISAILIGVSNIGYGILFAHKVSLEIGFSPFLLMLCLGFFFIVLSEIFKISRNLKDENELTI